MADEARIRVATADDAERRQIHQLRHTVYAEELRQHAVNAAGVITDELDAFNTFLVAARGRELLGFISITPPGHGRYSIDKYFERSALPFEVNDRLFEVRLLTVCSRRRGRRVAALLMYAAYRWVATHGGDRIVAIGRCELRDFYARVGLQPLGLVVRSGALTYELMSATTERLRACARGERGRAVLQRWQATQEWQLDMPYLDEDACFHGGASFEAIGDDFRDLDRRHGVINADVLDAWFPPAPGVLRVLSEHFPWLLRTAPPQDGAGLVRAISRSRGVPPESIALGAGSSSLIHLALSSWLDPAAHVLLPDPTYGEYEHVLSHLVGCRVERLPLSAEQGFRLEVDALVDRLRMKAFDLVVLVNPNNPTGGLLSRRDLERVIDALPGSTRLWVDEAYIDYEDPAQTIEPIAARHGRVVVCKSLSKVHALSGVRVAYLCGHPLLMGEIRRRTPPWAVSLPAQVAAVEALRDPAYAAQRHAETRRLRMDLTTLLPSAVRCLEVIGSGANFVLCRLAGDGPDAATLCQACRERGLFIRDAGRTSAALGTRAVRIAVKDAATNQRMVSIIADAMRALRGEHRAPSTAEVPPSSSLAPITAAPEASTG